MTVRTLLAALLAASSASAQPKDETPGYKLTVSPAAAPTRPLRYDLLPPRDGRTPGNAAVTYLRAALLMVKPRLDRASTGDERNEQWVKWREMPPWNLPKPEVRKSLSEYENALLAADLAARFSRCEWDTPPGLTLATMDLGYSDIAPIRDLGMALHLRAKLELADGRFDAAARTLQTMFQLGKHAGETSSLIQMFIGLAVVQYATAAADDWVQTPGSPNLYAALGSLPRPFVDPRPALDGEHRLLSNTLPVFREFEAGRFTDEEARAAARKHRESLAAIGNLGDKMKGVDGFLNEFGWNLYVRLKEGEARKDLIARGRPEAEAAALPATQAVYLYAWNRYLDLRDDIVAAFLLPHDEGHRAMLWMIDRQDEMARKARAGRDLLWGLLMAVMPIYESSHMAFICVDRRLTALRAVEALRLHAAAHGRWPNALADVTVVSVPDDPLTGKPFLYKREGDTFTLTAPPPGATRASNRNSFRYEVTLRKPSPGR